jgi:hypothetical protein
MSGGSSQRAPAFCRARQTRPGVAGMSKSRTPRAASASITAFMTAEQSGECQPLERAVAAYRAVLTEFTRESVLYDWAMTQSNRGLPCCFEGFRRVGSEDFFGMAEANLAGAQALIAERQAATAAE